MRKERGSLDLMASLKVMFSGSKAADLVDTFGLAVTIAPKVPFVTWPSFEGEMAKLFSF